MPVNNDVLIAKAILNHLNAWPDKSCNIRLETMDKAPIVFSMSMQQLSGTRVLKSYINGSFIGAWPFAVYVRFGNADTAKRFDAVSYLEALGLWMGEAALPSLGESRVADSIEMTSLPAIAAQYEDGGVDYQAIVQLTYTQKRSV